MPYGGGTRPRPLTLMVRLACHLTLHHHRILQKIHPAAVARAAVRLKVITGRARKAQSHVAAPAEPRSFRVFVMAFGTGHISLTLPERR